MGPSLPDTAGMVKVDALTKEARERNVPVGVSVARAVELHLEKSGEEVFTSEEIRQHFTSVPANTIRATLATLVSERKVRRLRVGGRVYYGSAVAISKLRHGLEDGGGAEEAAPVVVVPVPVPDTAIRREPPESRRRSEYEHEMAILKALADGKVIPTQVMQAANISWAILKRFLPDMAERGLIVISQEKRRRKLAITNLGLQKFQTWKEAVRM